MINKHRIYEKGHLVRIRFIKKINTFCGINSRETHFVQNNLHNFFNSEHNQNYQINPTSNDAMTQSHFVYNTIILHCLRHCSTV